MRKAASVFALAVMFSILLLAPLRAQNNGTLTGAVVDPSGAAVPNALIEVLLPGGNSAILQAKTGTDGSFAIPVVKPGSYKIAVTASGFAKLALTGITVDPGKETSLPPLKLQLATSAQTVDVVESPVGVQNTTFEVATTLTQNQVTNLPVLDRQINSLYSTQAGVEQNGVPLGSTVINGMRSQATNVTLDGINVQDQFIRLGGLDISANNLTIAQVAEFTISSANEPSNFGIGATQVTMTTPSGTDQFHGSAYYYNRNSAVEANQWFSNQVGTPKPFLNLNQYGVTIGGPIIKDKLFFYAAYESYRLRQQALANFTVLTSSARQGVMTLTDGSGSTANLLTATHNSIDPYVAKLLGEEPLPNNNLLGDGLNTGGYQFNSRDNATRDNILGRLDYALSPKNVFFGSYTWNRNVIDRNNPADDTFFTNVPPTFNDNNGRLLSVGWRWNPLPNLTNELRGGFNLAPAPFGVRTPIPPAYLISNIINLPGDQAFAPQGRFTDTYALQDNASWIHGNHTVTFGYQQQNIRVKSYDNNGGVQAPEYVLEFSPTNPNGLNAIPGLPSANANDVNTANNLLATLAGIVGIYQQTFNVTSRTSGFVPGAANVRNFQYDTYSAYVSDKWKIRPRLTVSAGLRWDYYPPLNEANSLFLTPEITNGNYISTILSNATLNFGGNSAGRPYYNSSKKNFAPSVGFAWDVFGDGKTAVRGGYSLSYYNDDSIIAAQNYIGTNAGLQTSVANFANNTVTANPPSIPAPTLQVPLTFLDNLNNAGPQNAEGIIDPNLKTPYIQQWSLSVQREVKKFVIDVRYVGNHGIHGWRGIDYNQVQVAGTPYLADFKNARNNLFLALAAGLGADADYNPAVKGSVQLPFLSTLPGGGLLNNPSITGLIGQGQAGQLASIYQQNFLPALNGGYSFFPSPYGLGMNALISGSYSSYHSGQIDVRRSLPNGQQLQINYVFSKALADSNADLNNNRFEPYLDLHNGRLDKARAPFDLTNCLKANYVVPIPIGEGHRLSANRLINHVIGGWTASGIVTYQGGSPYSIVSQYGTLNRGGSRALYNTVDSLTGKIPSNTIGFFMTGNGPYFVNPSATDPNTGLGVQPFGQAPFSGQVFADPGPGTDGSIQRRMFTGPNLFEWDAQVIKSIPITERVRIDFQAAFFNFTNHPNFTVGQDGNTGATGYNVNQPNFGKIIATSTIPRIIQFGAYIRF